MKSWISCTGRASPSEPVDLLHQLPHRKPPGRQPRSLGRGHVLEYVRNSESYESKQLALEFLILTAARTTEVRGARWAEIDFGEAKWTIPAERMKNRHVHRVPLSATALDLLRRAHRESYERWGASPNDLAFPDRSGKKMISQDCLRQFLRRKFDTTTHGFRATFRVWAAEKTDFAAEIVAHALAHLKGSATIRAYLRTDYFDRRRELMQAWADFATAELGSCGVYPDGILGLRREWG